MGASIHFTIEHRDPRDDLGWVGVFWSDALFSPVIHNPDRSARSFNSLGSRDYEFFARLAGVRGDGPEPNGVPPDASLMTRRCVLRWEGDGHSHGHMTLREFVKRKVISEESLAEAAKAKLQGDDPIAGYLGDYVDESTFITLDDNTRVVFWFDN